MTNRNIAKNQKGSSTFNLLMAVLIGLMLYFFVFMPYQTEKAINSFKAAPPKVTIEAKRWVDEYKAMAEPEIVPSGEYYVEGLLNGGKYASTYYFGDDKTVTKELMVLGKVKLSGSAKYHFDGSVLMYTDIIGDKYLFPEIGEPVSLPYEGVISLPHGHKDAMILKSSTAINTEIAEPTKVLAERN